MNNHLPLGNINKWLEQDPFEEVVYYELRSKNMIEEREIVSHGICSTRYIQITTKLEIHFFT